MIKDKFNLFIKMFGFLLACSLVPFGIFGAMLGLPATVVCSLFLISVSKDLKEAPPLTYSLTTFAVLFLGLFIGGILGSFLGFTNRNEWFESAILYCMFGSSSAVVAVAILSLLRRPQA